MNVSRFWPLWIYTVLLWLPLGTSLGGSFSTNVLHFGSPGPVCLACNLHIQQKVYKPISHTAQHFCYFLYRPRPRTLSLFCSRLKWRSLVFNDCFTSSACSASVMAFYIFLEVSWKQSVVTARPPPPFGAHMGSMLLSSVPFGTPWLPLGSLGLPFWRWIW